MYKYEFLIIIFNMRSCLQQPYPLSTHTTPCFPSPYPPPNPPKKLALDFFLNYANHTEHNAIIFDRPTP